MADDLFDDGTPQRQLSPIGLYSHAAEVAERFPQMKGTPQQFKAMLAKQGVKPDELKWSGYDQALGGQKLVTRDQLAQHFRLKLPPVQETTLGGGEGGRRRYRELDQRIARGERLSPEEMVELGRLDADPPATKFGQYTLPGGKNYREVLMHLPENIPTQTRKVHRLYNNGQLMAEGDALGAERWRQRNPAADIREEDIPDTRVAKDSPYLGLNYRSSHWDTPNVLAHLRMSDRALPGGKKALHLEELQSDWAQEGRKKGFKEGLPSESSRDFLTRRGTANEHLSDSVVDREARELGWDKGLPSAPYVDSTSKWLDLGLKRLLHEAATGGYDKVLVTPGEEQAKRYDLSKHVDKVNLVPAGPDAKYRIDAFKDSKKIIEQHAKDEHEVASIVGKEVAEKLFNNRNQHGAATLSGQDLKIGGEGMKAFYDRLLPQALEKLAKKHDPEAKVGRTSVQTDKEGWHITPPTETVSGKWMLKSSDYNSKGLHFDTEEAARKALAKKMKQTDTHSLDITPRMRASILKGQPAYAAGGKIGKAEGGLIASYPTDKNKEQGQMPPAISRALALSRGL